MTSFVLSICLWVGILDSSLGIHFVEKLLIFGQYDFRFRVYIVFVSANIFTGVISLIIERGDSSRIKMAKWGLVTGTVLPPVLLILGALYSLYS
jgi:hypothetical protein